MILPMVVRRRHIDGAAAWQMLLNFLKRRHGGEFLVVLVTSTLISGFDFRHGASCVCSMVTIALKRTVFKLWTWNRRTGGRIAALLKAPYYKAGA